MQVNGIIAEYNPFHNGHKFHLEESQRRTGADYTLVVMSGNFVQRGDPALIEKHVRAEMALRCGADLVLELPALYSASSAEYFATGAVALMDKLGVVNHLCFGSECGDVELLQKISTILLDEPPEFSATMKRYLQQGLSYPNARTWALMQCYPFLNEYKDVFSTPNNILGIEYCKALQRRDSQIAPMTVKRLGSGYHDRQMTDQVCSALALRQALHAGSDLSLLCRNMPKEAGELLTAYLEKNKPIRLGDFSAILYYKLLLEKSKGYTDYLDVSQDLSDRIRNRLGEFRGYEKFCNLLKTKEMTYTRISRCLLHILLDIKKEDMELSQSLDCAPYARVLGFRKSASDLLAAIKERSSIPLVTKLADAGEILSPEAYRFLQRDILISEIYYGISAGRAESTATNEYSAPLVIL